MKRILTVSLLLLTTGLFAQNTIPSGTILPLRLNSSLNSRKSRAGQKITASVAQEVPLLSGFKIHAGAKLIGHIVSVTPATEGTGAELSFQFGTLRVVGRDISLTGNLRALASMMDVYEAQLPKIGSDRGTPQTAWVTEQIGEETDYHGGWSVTRGAETVGTSLLPNGVLARVSAPPGTKCRGEVDGNYLRQAVWVFASDACGTYGFEDLTIAHAGRTNPVGEIVLRSRRRDINVRGGSGMLVRVINSSR